MLRTFILSHEPARLNAIEAVRTAPAGQVVQIKDPTRNGDQNAKFHAICSDFAKSSIQWAGKRRSAEEWKVLLISGHAVATKQGAEIVPGLENEFVNIRESSARMSKQRMCSLIEYAQAMFDTMKESR